MLKESKLSEYIKDFPATWVPEMPDGVPPEDICVPFDHTLYRLTDGEDITECDLVTYYEMDPSRDWGDKYRESYAVSMFDDLSKTSKLTKIASLRNKKGVSMFVLNPENGVVKQTGKPFHYSWWKTNKIDITAAKTVLKL